MNMPPKRRFTQHEEDLLIDFVKTNSFLYNRDHPEYRNTELRNRTWKKFAKKMNINTKLCIHRWYNMRDYYKCKRKTSSSGPVRRREQQLSFLNQDSTQSQPSIEVVTTNDAKFTEVSKTEINSLEYEGGASNEYESQSVSNDSISANQPSGDEYAVEELLFEKQVGPEEFSSQPNSSISATPFVTKQTAQGHSLDIFFRAMCATVKTFPKADIAEIKLKISQVVGTKEIEILNRAPK